MFSLTPREQTLLVFVLAATLLGAAIKHARETRRERLAEANATSARQEASASPTKTRRAPRSAGQVKTPPPPPDIALAEEPADR